jgi:hypothetical protein
MDPTVTASLTIGAVGVLVGALAVVYSRSQVDAARRQAGEAARVAEIESSRRMLEEFRELRRRRFTSPALLKEAREASPEIVPLLDAEGGVEAFLVQCDTLDAFQEVFLLRKRGFVSDEHWTLWVEMHMLGPAKLPAFRAVWEASVKNEWLLPAFIAFYAPAFTDSALRDPLTGKG